MAEDNSEALQGAARKRLALKEAVSSVETAAASASAGPSWRSQLAAKLEQLSEALDQHVEEVEAADGLLAEMTSLAPRLIGRIDEIRAEHPVLCQQAAETLAAVTDDRSDVDTIRAAVLELLSAVVGHRQKGADLVYEGYEVDLGGG